MKRIILSVTFAVATTLTIFGQSVKKRDGAVLTATSVKVGKLTQGEIRDLLLTFSKDCRNNIEFSEWSNELLFATIDRQTELTLATIEKNEKKLEMSEILINLGSPINDKIDIKKLLAKVGQVKMDVRLKKQITDQLKLADESSN